MTCDVVPYSYALFVQDARLTEAVRLYKAEGWARVAEHLSGGVSGQQCIARWSGHLEPVQQGLKKGAEWSEAEVIPRKITFRFLCSNWQPTLLYTL